MKNTKIWAIRFLLVYAATTGFLFAAYLLKGGVFEVALRDAATWGMIATAIFIGSRVYATGQGKACGLCRDTVENRSGRC